MRFEILRQSTVLVLVGLVGISHSFSGPAAAQDASTSVEPLMIQEQGSFAVGGTVLTRPGTFDATNRSPAGQTLHGDMRTCSTKSRYTLADCRLCCGTG